MPASVPFGACLRARVICKPKACDLQSLSLGIASKRFMRSYTLSRTPEILNPELCSKKSPERNLCSRNEALNLQPETPDPKSS